jgi:rhodanese-related sulfurtransferase
METVTVEELKVLLDSDAPPLVLDVREEWEYAICHIQDSLNIPMSGIMNKLDKLDKNQDTVVLCHHGMRSLQVANYLENAGFQKVSNLEGGIAAWAAVIEPGMPQY